MRWESVQNKTTTTDIVEFIHLFIRFHFYRVSEFSRSIIFISLIWVPVFLIIPWIFSCGFFFERARRTGNQYGYTDDDQHDKYNWNQEMKYSYVLFFHLRVDLLLHLFVYETFLKRLIYICRYWIQISFKYFKFKYALV